MAHSQSLDHRTSNYEDSWPKTQLARAFGEDGERRRWLHIAEPLWHNKTAFPIVLLGEAEVNRLKDLCRRLNQERLIGDCR